MSNRSTTPTPDSYNGSAVDTGLPIIPFTAGSLTAANKAEIVANIEAFEGMFYPHRLNPNTMRLDTQNHRIPRPNSIVPQGGAPVGTGSEYLANEVEAAPAVAHGSGPMGFTDLDQTSGQHIEKILIYTHKLKAEVNAT